MSKIKFYDYYWPDCYEELITFYPRFYREVLEMVAILHAHGHLADMMQDDIERVYQNSFIDDMDEETLSRLELFLQIGLDKERSLEERRRLVKSFFVGFGKVSASMLKEMIKSYTGADVDMVFEPSDEERNNTLYIYIQRGDVDTLYMSDISLLLSKKIPAHINWIAAVVYKRAVVVGASRKHYRFSYDLTGTKPDITLHGDLNHVEVVVEADRRNKVTGYRQADQNREISGVYPDIALHGSLSHVDVAVKAGRSTQLTDYRQADEAGELAGTTPGIATQGQRLDFGAVIGATEESTIYGHKHAASGDKEVSGLFPEAAAHGSLHSGITAQAEVKATSYGADYKFCGTTVAHT